MKKPKVKLSGEDGNVFSIIGHVRNSRLCENLSQSSNLRQLTVLLLVGIDNPESQRPLISTPAMHRTCYLCLTLFH